MSNHHLVYFGKCPDLKSKFNKCGRTSNIINRKYSLQTSYPLSQFNPYMVILCQSKKKEIEIETLIHSEYIEYNTIHKEKYNGTSTEWFDYDFNYAEISKLLKNNFHYNTILINDELGNYMSTLLQKKYCRKDYIQQMRLLKKERVCNYTPNDIQHNILENITQYYTENNKGKLIASCGVGKTLASLFICKKMEYTHILIGVPYSNLLEQWKEEVGKLYLVSDILIIGGSGITDPVKISLFLKLNRPRIIITTYSSAHLVKSVANELNFKFNIKIGDEAHHLASIAATGTKNWVLFHTINSHKDLYLTATEKFIENKTNKTVYSMDDVQVFGDNIYPKISTKWSIDNKKITDYQVLLLKNTEEQVNDIIKNMRVPIRNRSLFISAYISLKSFQKYSDLTHLLIYCNKTDNAKLIVDYITLIIEKGLITFDEDEFYYKDLHSNSVENKAHCVRKFKLAKYGIISCVYEFGEGFNCPEINGVVFAENMESEFRIIQCALRANRLDIRFPNKIAYYIIPWIDTDEWGDTNTPFEKVKKIIAKLGNEDDIISKKIILSTIAKTKKKEGKTVVVYDDFGLVDDENELKKIKLRLRYKGSLRSKCSVEEDELNYVRNLNKELNIQDKYQYSKTKTIHSHYIDNPASYFMKYAIWKGWYDFLGLETKQFIQTKDEWVTFCQEKKVNSVSMYNDLCKKYIQLPNEPIELYIGFTNIGNELGLFSKRR